ncbi:MAG: valine--tRNA ligase [Ruminococcaceae bacterium]|nr:valine--tRNA ligase [Oscillospiraceae bacterium]
MRKELPKTYDPASFEKRIYQAWCKDGCFTPVIDKSKPHYSIVMPPPNITGQLHMGHALDNTLQDILTRYKRMSGFCTLWLPGTDHASIATEAKIVEAMRKEGLTKDDLGRDKFLERAWAWKEQYGGRIVEQLKILGSSCDWNRERFTMDEGCSEAVQDVFLRLYKKGLIYRGNRMVNWCTTCKTSISDAEVEYEDQNGNFYHILYPVKETGEMLELATTRPETMLGDTAVAINAEDPRYAHLHGCHVVLPLINKEIPIVCDEHADMTKGTGVVKITPAHDPNDYEVGQRHNLPMVRVFTYDGKMTGAQDRADWADSVSRGTAAVGEPEVLDCGKYAGMTTVDARKAILADLKEAGLLKNVEPLAHNVGTCYRCHHVIEPMVSKQWFVKMEPLAKPAIEAVRDGRIKFVPERFSKNYFHWMENIRDWCISRQLWWGHRIPAYYCDECGEMVVSRESVDVCPKCGGVMTQDPDTLDTWFSSALWPFSTMGWPTETEDLKYFYPTNTLVTGYDIITFWVSRMIFSALEYTGEIPFDTVLIHGLVRDAQGRKMSKSLGNGIDPLEIVDKYGADALRFALATGNSPGNDMRFSDEKIEAARNFANKLWNAARFVMMNLEIEKIELPELSRLAAEDKWILARLNETIEGVRSNLDNYEIGIALGALYDFVWDVYCDWYIELSKASVAMKGTQRSLDAQNVLAYVLCQILKLLHPFMPFITEEIYRSLPGIDETIMLEDYPAVRDDFRFPEDEAKIERVRDAITQIRARRAEMNVPPSRKAKLYIVTRYPASFDESTHAFFARMASASAVEVVDSYTEEGAVQLITDAATIYIPMADMVDFEAERKRLEGELAAAEGEIARANAKLANENFVSRAPAAVVDAERAKVEKYEAQRQGILDALKALK